MNEIPLKARELLEAWERDELTEGDYIEGLRSIVTQDNLSPIMASLPDRIRNAFVAFVSEWSVPGAVIRVGDGTPVQDAENLIETAAHVVAWRAEGTTKTQKAVNLANRIDQDLRRSARERFEAEFAHLVLTTPVTPSSSPEGWKIGWKLWLDDVRDPLTEAPEDRDFIWCRDCHQAMYYTRMWGPPSFMALDHDLGITIDQHVIGSTRTEDVLRYLRWLANKHPDSCPEYRVHSANPEGQKNIVSFMQSWEKSKALGIQSE